MVKRIDSWFAGLYARARSLAPFAEEIHAITEALREFVAAAGPAPYGVVPYFVAARKRTVLVDAHPLEHAAALAAGMVHPEEYRRPPPTPEGIKLPSVMVQRTGTRVYRVDGRARVGCNYRLLLDGMAVPGVTGSRRTVCRQAHWAVMMDATGTVPMAQLLTGLAKRRAAYRRRRGLGDDATVFEELVPMPRTPRKTWKPRHGDRRGKAQRRAAFNRALVVKGKDVRIDLLMETGPVTFVPIGTISFDHRRK